MTKYEFRKRLNKLLFGRLLKFSGSIRSDKIDNNEIVYHTKSEIGISLFYNGEFEKNELEICKRYLKQDSIILDIGANIGIHSIYFSKIASKGLILSFEPSNETFILLLKNVSQFENIVPINIAISDRNSVSKFFIASDNAYSSLKDTQRKAIKRVINVPCIKLDEFSILKTLNKIDFIKIDVEGFESEVIKGMGSLIDKYKPIIFCEIYQGSSSNSLPDKTVELLINKGYSAFVLQNAYLVEYTKHNDNYYNYFFIPKS